MLFHTYTTCISMQAFIIGTYTYVHADLVIIYIVNFFFLYALHWPAKWYEIHQKLDCTRFTKRRRWWDQTCSVWSLESSVSQCSTVENCKFNMIITCTCLHIMIFTGSCVMFCHYNHILYIDLKCKLVYLHVTQFCGSTNSDSHNKLCVWCVGLFISSWNMKHCFKKING